MSSEDELDETQHRFARPDHHFKTVLESGAIPDAAMIHEARKKRQKAREQGLYIRNNLKHIFWRFGPAFFVFTNIKFDFLGDFIEIEEKKPVNNKKGRLIREDADDDNSDDEERVDMSAITGVKEREERREKFYSVQQECEYRTGLFNKLEIAGVS